MGKAEWSVTVSDELNDAVMAYLAKSGQGVEGLSNLVENAVGKFVKDPRALDKESDVTEGEINDMINAAVQRTKEKYSSLTEGREVLTGSPESRHPRHSPQAGFRGAPETRYRPSR